MESQEEASTMVEYFTSKVVPVSGRALDVQLSTIKELKNSQPHPSNMLPSQTLLKALQVESLKEAESKYNRASGDAIHRKLTEGQTETEDMSILRQNNAQSY